MILVFKVKNKDKIHDFLNLNLFQTIIQIIIQVATIFLQPYLLMFLHKDVFVLFSI